MIVTLTPNTAVDYTVVVPGLALNATGVIDAPLPPRAVPEWDSSDRRRNFWLLNALLFLGAAVARSGFIRR